MLFYQIKAELEKVTPVAENNSEAYMPAAAEICLASEDDYLKHGKDHFIFADDIGRDRIYLTAIFKTVEDVETIARRYLAGLQLTPIKLSVEETVSEGMGWRLKSAERKGLVRDSEGIINNFEMGGFRGIDYGEKLLSGKMVKSAALRRAKELFAERTLVPELERIYRGSARPGVKGHPVHYLIRTDNLESRKEISRLLMNVLYANGRIQSRRYSFLDINEDARFGEAEYDRFYAACVGGTVIVRCSLELEEADSNRARPGADLFRILGQTAEKYRNDVLTIFCLPLESRKLQKALRENLGYISLIELYEDLTCGEDRQARDYLKGLARRRGIRPDKRLYAKLTDQPGGKAFRADDLRAIFEGWYDTKLKNELFPQYKEAETVRAEIIKILAKGNAIDRLDSMIGLTEAKEVIHKALNYYKAQMLCKSMGMATDHPAMHMVFTGNPGTAKTTVARLFAEIMRDNGLLSRGDLYEVGRADLVGKYVGWTASIVKGKFQQARGSVLFIDEAYSLVEERGGMYGDEAINTIVQEMENNRENMVVIFAGYPDKMEEFLSRNPGLRSRIAFHVPFPDYSVEELTAIASSMAEQKGLCLTETATKKLQAIFEMVRHTPDFGNGRCVRNLLEQARMEQTSRIVKMNPEEVTRETLATLTEEDIRFTAAESAPRKQRIGFAG